MKDYTLIDHTADIGIHVAGKNLQDIFIKAAAAMFDVIAQPVKRLKATDKKQIAIELKADSYDELLLEWLSELLSLSDAKRLIFTDFKILKLTKTSLKAKVYSSARRNFSIEREIKAVTYHHLKIEQKRGQYHAEIIFDV